MLRKLVLFLIRRKLKVGVGTLFRFSNQKTGDLYFFTEDKLMKYVRSNEDAVLSDIPLNYILSDQCQIKILG